MLNTVPTIGENIRRQRELLDVNQGELAKRLNVPQSQLSAWENDRYRTLETETLLRLAKALNCSIDDLLEGIDPVYDEVASRQTGVTLSLGTVVRRKRTELGLTVEQLAQETGLAPPVITALEADRRRELEVLQPVAVALGMTTAELTAARIQPAPEVRGRRQPKISRATGIDNDVDDEIIDVSDYNPHDIPVITEGEASPQGSLFWTDDGVLKSDVDDRISCPGDVRDPKAYGVRVRGTSMIPVFKPGMVLIVSPSLPVTDGAEVYVQLVSGERLIKIARRVAGGWLLESTNPAYEPRYVDTAEVGAIHPVVWARRARPRTNHT